MITTDIINIELEDLIVGNEYTVKVTLRNTYDEFAEISNNTITFTASSVTKTIPFLLRKSQYVNMVLLEVVTTNNFNGTSNTQNTVYLCPTPTPTVTPSKTPTSTPTSSISPTPTTTPTPTHTASATVTPTNTPTNSITPTETPTNTPTTTNTQSAYSTPTATKTRTPTRTPTSSLSPTPTNTHTASHTPTNTASHTPTNTASHTPTNTASHTPTNTASHTPTHTMTHTASRSPTPTATYTASPTPSHTSGYSLYFCDVQSIGERYGLANQNGAATIRYDADTVDKLRSIENARNQNICLIDSMASCGSYANLENYPNPSSQYHWAWIPNTSLEEGGSWQSVSANTGNWIGQLQICKQALPIINATGGNVVCDVGDYRVHKFLNSADFDVSLAELGAKIEILVVAGGGGGGGRLKGGGGGGAGGLLHRPNMDIVAGVYNITVGNGGSIDANGGNSSIIGTGITEIAIGGGRGGSGNGNGGDGGSGGGGAAMCCGPPKGARGLGIPGQGHDGHNASGSRYDTGGSGGGAGAPGVEGNPYCGPPTGKSCGRPGGEGKEVLIAVGCQAGDVNNPNWYAGGGACAGQLSDGGAGGNRGGVSKGGGGGEGQPDGQPNTGGGGAAAALGGSGIVIIKYRIKDTEPVA